MTRDLTFRFHCLCMTKSESKLVSTITVSNLRWEGVLCVQVNQAGLSCTVETGSVALFIHVTSCSQKMAIDYDQVGSESSLSDLNNSYRNQEICKCKDKGEVIIANSGASFLFLGASLIVPPRTTIRKTVDIRFWSEANTIATMLINAY